MKKNYQTPALLLLSLAEQDILTLSTQSNGEASVWNLLDDEVKLP